jgi:hypothetical protein
MIPENRFDIAREEESKRAVLFRQVFQRNGVDWSVQLSLEVVHPELVEIAENAIPWSLRNEAGPILESLGIVLAEILPSLLHLDNDYRLPD